MNMRLPLALSALHAKEEERIRRLNRETKLYFEQKPLNRALHAHQEELVALRSKLKRLEETVAEGEQQEGLVEAALEAFRTQIEEQKKANSEHTAKVEEAKRLKHTAQQLYDEARIRHMNTKKLLKEELMSTLHALTDASATCHTMEGDATKLQRTVVELSKRLEQLSKEATDRNTRAKRARIN